MLWSITAFRGVKVLPPTVAYQVVPLSTTAVQPNNSGAASTQSTSEHFWARASNVDNSIKSAMSPRLSLWSASRGLAIRVASRSSMVQRTPISVRAIPTRSYSDKPKPHTNPSDPENPAHVSEEAAQIAEIMGETKPDISQGTPVQEVHPARDTLKGPGGL